MNEITIASSQETDFHAFIKKLNKKALRHNVEPLAITEKSRQIETKRVRQIDSGGYDGPFQLQQKEHVIEYQVETITYEVTGKPFALNGWEFVATIEHTEKGNMFYKAPSSYGIEIPDTYKETSVTLCEHCHTKRERKDTYLIRNAEKGDFKQVGKICLKDFLGVNSIAGFEFQANITQFLQDWDISESYFNEKPNCIKGSIVYDLKDFLSATLFTIDELGWTSSSDSFDYGKPSTKDNTIEFLELPYALQNEAKTKYKSKFDHYSEKANKIIEWMNTIEPNNDYLDKLLTVARLGYVTQRVTGIVASAPIAYSKYLERVEREKAQNEAAKKSNFIGNEKERLAFEALKVKNIIPCENRYGISYLCLFEDKDGNALKWFSSNCPSFDTGDFINLKGTVKNHETYKGIKQTALTRCKVF